MLTFGYILLFILCLSTLIMVHEAGHLATAKMFNVYCFEYSIGFGPKIFKVRRKGGETYFSLRAIPFGGFVKMYGEAESVPEGEQIDPSRSLLNIKKWKRLIIMLAGVTMNFVLAIVIFFACEIGFPKYVGHSSRISVAPNSIAETVGLQSDDFVYSYLTGYDNTYVFYDNDATITYCDENNNNPFELEHVFFGYNFSSLSINNTSLFDHSVAFASKEIGDVEHFAVEPIETTVQNVRENEVDPDAVYKIHGYVKAYGSLKIDVDESSRNVLAFQITDHFYQQASDGLLVAFEDYSDNQNDFKFIGNGLEITCYGKISNYDENNKMISPKNRNYEFLVPDFENCNNLFANKYNHQIPQQIDYKIYSSRENTNGQGKGDENIFSQKMVANGSSYRLEENPGISMKLTSYRTSYGDAVKNCFVDFADAATLIGRSLGELFTNPKSWENVGGIIAVGVMTTRTLQENGFGSFLNMWAVISVNLAIINLLPFPGLDGWHCLVTIIEGVSRKELPSKFKTIMSVIGLAILFVLMIAIVIKDVIAFI